MFRTVDADNHQIDLGDDPDDAAGLPSLRVVR